MDQPPRHERYASLVPDQYQETAFRTARYQELDYPLEVLRIGLGDELVEITEEAYGGDDYWTVDNASEGTLPLAHWKEELGDLLWYGSQIARFRGEKLSNYLDAESWQALAPATSTSVKEHVSNPAWYEEEYPTHHNYNPDFSDKPVACLIVLWNQLSGVIIPLNSWNRLHWDKEASVEKSLGDFLKGITLAANLRGLALNEIAQANLQKLEQRPREPHTVTHTKTRAPSYARRKTTWLLHGLIENEHGVFEPEPENDTTT